MSRSSCVRWWLVALVWGTTCLVGCAKRIEDRGPAAVPDRSGSEAADKAPSSADQAKQSPKQQEPVKPARQATAAAADVEAAQKRLDALGTAAKYKVLPGGLLTEIAIQDGSQLTADDVGLFGKLTDLERLQIYNCRSLDDAMAAQLSGLKNLTTLALTNSVINDPTVEMIAQSFPNLIDLDLSSNPNVKSGTMKVIATLSKLQRLTLVQNRFTDLSTRRLAQLQDLRLLDLRGNMEAANKTLEVVAGLPKLTVFKHRSTAVTDPGIEYLSHSPSLESLLLQDFAITDEAGPHLAKLGTLTQLEIFRCPSFGSAGVVALKGLKLNRLTLRDLPMVNDQAMEVFADLPALERLYLHELASVSDGGLKHLAALKSLEVLDIWTVPQMTDATIDVLAALPQLKELSIRTTGVTDAAVDKLLGMQNLQSLTFKDNGSVTEAGLQKLATRQWSKLDTGSAGAGAAE